MDEGEVEFEGAYEGEEEEEGGAEEGEDFISVEDDDPFRQREGEEEEESGESEKMDLSR